MNFQIRTSRLPLFLLLAAMVSVAGGDPSRTDGPATSSATPPSTAAAAVSRLRGAILDGASSQRLRALGEILADPATWAALNDEMLEAFHRAAGDPDPRVRAELARIAGNRWIWGAVEQHPRAVELMIRLARDEDRKVRYNAVYFGLSTADKSDAVIRAMLDAAARAELPAETEMIGRIAWGLGSTGPERWEPVFERFFADHREDPAAALGAYVIYTQLAGREPAAAAYVRDTGGFLIVIASVPDAGVTEQQLEREIRAALGAGSQRIAEYIPFVEGVPSAMVVIRGVGDCRAFASAFEADPRFRPMQATFLSDLKQVPGIKQHLAGYLARQGGGLAPTTALSRTVSYEEAFRDLHEHLGRRYPNFTMKQIDWSAVGEELIPRAAAVKTDEEFGLLCMKLVARLEDSHAHLLAGSAKVPQVPFPQWDVGLACLIDDRGRPTVFHVEHSSPAAEARIRPGMTVVSLNDRPASEVMDEWMKRARTHAGYSSERALRYDAARMFHRQVDRGATVTLVLEDPGGVQRSVRLPATLGTRYVPRLPVPVDGINDSADVSWTTLPGDVGYIYVRRIRAGLPEALDRAVRELGEARGLIIDVRGNSGGGFDGKRALRNFDPDDREEPDRPRYAGPIAVLIDERCISAGEGWASWFVANKRARLFGTATSGASGRKEIYPLSNGLYQVRFPVKAYTGFLDRPIERRGLEPEVEVRCSAKGLAAGVDTVREAARHWLHEQSGVRQTKSPPAARRP